MQVSQASDGELPFIATVLHRARGQHLGKNIAFDNDTRRYSKISGNAGTNLANSYFFQEFRGEARLHDRWLLRKYLSKPEQASCALIGGSIHPDLAAEMEIQRTHPGGVELWSRRDFAARDKFFRDEPRRTLTFDVDGFAAARLWPDFNARHAAEQDVHWIIEQLFKELGADCFNGQRVIQFSSGFGLYDEETIREHIDIDLAEPLTLADQKILAQILNDRARENGLLNIDPTTGTVRDLFDLSIYRPNSLLFTSKAQIVRADFARYSAEELRNYEHFEPRRRLFYIDRGEPRAVLPADLRQEMERIKNLGEASHRRSRRSRSVSISTIKAEGDERLTRSQLISRMAPGDIHNPCISLIASIANTRVDRALWLLEHCRQAVIAQIERLAVDEVPLDDRLREHANESAWLKEYKYTFDKFLARNQRTSIVDDERAIGAFKRASVGFTARTVAGARAELEKIFTEARDAAFSPRETFDETPLVLSPRFDIIKAPPGIGKSTTWRKVMAPHRLIGKRVATFLPTDQLAHEVNHSREAEWKDLLEARSVRAEHDGERTYEALENHLRWLRGRQRHCKADVRTQRAAQALEQAGRSARRVCETCKLKENCKWFINPRTFVNDNILQHAHIHTLVQRSDERFDFFNVDESILAIALAEPCKTGRSLDELREFVAGTSVRRRRDPLPKIGRLKGADRRAAQEARRKAKRERELAKRSAAVPSEDPVSLHATTDARNAYAQILSVLERSEGRIKTDQLGFLRVKQTVHHKQPSGEFIEKTTPKTDVISSSIGTHQRSIRNRMEELSLSLAQLAEDAKETRVEIESLLREAGEKLDISLLFTEILKAFRASLNISARDEVMAVRLFEASGKKHVRAHVIKNIAGIFKGAPAVISDGTLDFDLTKRLLHGAGYDFREHDIRVLPEPGAYHLTQYPQRPFGKSGLVDAATGKPTEVLMAIRRLIWVEAERWAGHGKCVIAGKSYDGFVGAQKDVLTALEKLGLPERVYTLHYGGERGINALTGLKFGVVIGRQMPETQELVKLTEALHANDDSVLALTDCCDFKDRPKESRTLPMVDGRLVRFPIESVPDIHVARLQRHFLDASVAQMLGRVRVFDRKADNPVILHVLGQADTGLPITQVGRLQDADRDAADLMLEAGFVVDRQDLAERFCEIRTRWAGEKRRGGWVRGTHGGEDAFADQMAWLRDKVAGRTTPGPKATNSSQIPLASTKVDIFVGRSGIRQPFVAEHALTAVRFTSALNRQPATCWLSLSRYGDAAQTIARLLDVADVRIIDQPSTKRRPVGRRRTLNPSPRSLARREQRARKAANGR